MRRPLDIALFLALLAWNSSDGYASQFCDPPVMAHAERARDYVTSGVDARVAHEEWRQALYGGAAIVWTATLYDVDARSFFVLAFDRGGIRIYRLGQLAAPLVTRFGGVPEPPARDRVTFWNAMAGCLPAGIAPAAIVPWNAVRELKAGNWVLWFKLDRAVQIESDRRKRKSVRELKVNLHGASGDIQYYFTYDPHSSYGYSNLRGIGFGPADFQARVRHTLIVFFDPDGRIKLPKQSRGAGW
jgi:hypothetical protein